MADTVVIAEEHAEPSGYRFSWGLAVAGGAAAAAVTFVILSLGSGFGLLLVGPHHHAVSAPAFVTGGAVYFLVAQAFGFAVGGHIAGRLLGALVETQIQEDVRAGIHGLVVWAIAVLAAIAIVGLASLTLAGAGANTAALYGASNSRGDVTGPTAYLVDKLFRPGASSPTSTDGVSSDSAQVRARAEAARLLEAGAVRGEAMTGDDRTRLVTLTSQQAAIPRDTAEQRVSTMQRDLATKARQAAEIARKTASYASLWIAFSLIFGAIVAMAAAIFARNEDDRDAATR